MTPAKKIYKTKTMDFYSADAGTKTGLPLFYSKVSAGFPSPADDYIELKLDLNQYLIKHPAATFYVKVKGNSMDDAGIKDGDMLVVDRALEPKNNDIVVCILNGDFTVKRIQKKKDGLYLQPENSSYKTIKVSEDSDFEIWGVVSYIIHKSV